MSREKKAVEDQFPAGTTVRLKSGGPVMVVSGATGAGRVVCQWFAGDDLRAGKFAPDALVVADTAESAVPARLEPQPTPKARRKKGAHDADGTAP